MRTKKTVKVLTPVAACLAALVMLAAPAVAVPSPFDIEAVEMRISVGGINFDTPSGNPVNCLGSTGISGEFDDSAGTIEGTIDIQSSDFVLPIFGGTYQLIATGTSASGTFNFPDFYDMSFPDIEFEIWAVDTDTCTQVRSVCEGTAALTAAGTILGTPPPTTLQTGDLVEVQAEGEITSTSNCAFPWNFVLGSLPEITVGANPNGSYYPLGAIFEQA